MARIIRVGAARKERICSKCGKTIRIGATYLKATPYRQATIYRCTQCGLKSYETSSSEYIREVGSICEDWENSYGLSESTADEIASVLTDLRDQAQDSFDNIPEQLQDGETGSMLQERIDMLDDAISELENISWDDCASEAKEEAESEIGEYEPGRSEYASKDEFDEALEDKITELTEDKVREAIEDALSGLSY